MIQKILIYMGNKIIVGLESVEMKCLEGFTATWMEKNEIIHVNCKIIGTVLNNILFW